MKEKGFIKIVLVASIAVIALFITGLFVPQSRNFAIDQFNISTDRCLENGTCVTVTPCGGDNQGTSGRTGCLPGKPRTVWKDDKLKSQYKEITSEKAKECLFKFIEENKNSYTRLQHINYSTLDIGSLSSSGSVLNVDKQDKYFWYMEISTDPYPAEREDIYHKNNQGYKLTFKVGAQTCEVYPDLYLLERPF